LHFFQKKHTFPGVVLRTSYITFRAEQQLTYHNTFKRGWLGKSNLYSQPNSFSWYTYVSPKASRDGLEICPLQSSHECTLL